MRRFSFASVITAEQDHPENTIYGLGFVDRIDNINLNPKSEWGIGPMVTDSQDVVFLFVFFFFKKKKTLYLFDSGEILPRIKKFVEFLL